MPADAYYGELNNDWPTDPASSPNFLPSDVALIVGRVDFFNMPGVGAPNPWPSEVELLRNYLNKDHAWRTHQIYVQRRALMGNRRGDEDGIFAFAASGYRNFEPFVGPGNTQEADISDTAPDDQRWISLLAAGSYLWAYGDGAGQNTAISFLGTDAASFYDVNSTDVVGLDPQVPFVMIFGSHFGNWDVSDDIMRAFLATPSMGLAACLVGNPHWFVHHMGLGETIGYGSWLTLNNSTLYQNETNAFTRAVYITLMGDPTLRLDPEAPPSGLTAVACTGVTLYWSASPDPVLGYYVYRASSPAGPFTRLTSSLVTGTSYTDSGGGQGPWTYMVRAVALESHFSGSYFNPSEGVFVDFTSSVLPPQNIVVTAQAASDGLELNWNSQGGMTYRVLASDSLDQPNWTDISGTLTSAGANLEWTDTSFPYYPQRFYMIASP
jgi:hypothetical protein